MRRVLDTLPWLAALALLVTVAQPSWAAKSPDEMPEGGTANAAPPAARVSYLDGTLYCWGPFDDEKRHLILNDVVREGDELYAAPGTWAEIEFPGSTFLRLDGGSSVIVQHYRDDLVLIPTAGAFYVSTGDWNRAAVRFGPDAVEAASTSLVRLDISPDEYRRVATVHGLARLEGDELSLELVEQEQAWAERFGARWDLGRFVVRDGDDFDLWNLDREDILRRPLDDDTPSYPLVGYTELHDYGTWVVVDGVWVWRPYVEAGWRPFTRGEWIWVGGYGWTWVSGYTWGYVTSHHGRWVYDPFYGWVWMPGMTWAPAWVTWSVHGHNVGWCPIDWWGYPVVITVGWYSYWDYRCWTFCHHNYFYHGGYHHHGAYHYHHHHHNSHHRHSSSHSSHHGGHASSSHARQDGSAGASASHERDSGASNSRGRAFGSDFRTFDKGEFESAKPSAVRNANEDLLRRDTMSSGDRQAWEGGGTSRDTLLAQRFPGDRQDAGSSRPGRGAAAETSRGAAGTSRGTGTSGGKSGTATGIRGEGSTGSERPALGETRRSGAVDTSRAGATGGKGTSTTLDRSSTTPVRPHTGTTGSGSSYVPRERSGSSSTDTRGTRSDSGSSYVPRDRSSSSSTGTRSTYTLPDRSSSSSSSTSRPYVPHYQGRSDGQKGYSGTSRSSGSSTSTRSSSSSSSSRPSYSGTSSSRSKSSSSKSSSSSTRSRSSSSSKSKSSSGSSSRSRSSGSKKKK